MSQPSEQIARELHRHNYDLIRLADFNYEYPDKRPSGSEIPFDLDGYQLEKTDVVVLDGYWYDQSYQKALREYPVTIVVIEDNGGGTYYADAVINHAPGLLKENYKTDNPGTRYALGPEYALLRPLFLEAARKEATPKTEIKQVLICFGGSDICNMTEIYASWFLDNTSFQVHAIIGGYQSNTLEQMASRNRNLKISSGLNEREMLEAFHNADLGIVPASGLLYEAMACSLPIISGYTASNQNKIHEGGKKRNVFFDIGDMKESTSNLGKIIHQLEAIHLHKMQKQQQKLINGRSPDNYCRLFKTLVK